MEQREEGGEGEECVAEKMEEERGWDKEKDKLKVGKDGGGGMLYFNIQLCIIGIKCILVQCLKFSKFINTNVPIKVMRPPLPPSKQIQGYLTATELKLCPRGWGH